MKFAIQINASPWQNQACETAYQFIKAALESGHEIVRVFFYAEAAVLGQRWLTPPEEEQATLKRWSELAKIQGIDLVICISAAQRRGLLESSEATRLGKSGEDLAEGFRIAGLSLWVEACLKADRSLVFGG